MEKPFAAYTGKEPYVFVCYDHDDSEVVYPEISWLHDQGVNIWYDEGIDPGSEFPERIAKAILDASLFLFYVSPESVESRFCRDEVYFAKDKGKLILASYIAPAVLPPGLALTTGTTQALMRYETGESDYRGRLLASITAGDAGSAVSSGDRQVPNKSSRRGLVVGVLALVTVAGLSVGYRSVHQYLETQKQIDRAKNELLPAIEAQIETGWRDFTLTYPLAVEAEQVIPDDPGLKEIFDEISLTINVDTEPDGASVYYKPYARPEHDWEYLGVTPIHDLRVPIGIFRWRIEKQGYETVEAAASSWDLSLSGSKLIVPSDFFRQLDPIGTVPDGMVRVSGRKTPAGEVADFFIDRFEVTNEDFQKFVDNGGYREERYWIHDFIEDGQIIPFAQAMERFVDETGRPGPATWIGGTYAEGRALHPVSGVSWYEADAYANFKGRFLPTGTHWGLARGEYSPLIEFPHMGGYAVFAPFSNMEGTGTVEVGSLNGVGAYGAYDLAGNVREWCFNETPVGRLVRGGGFDESPYRFAESGQAPPMFRNPGYGFRTALYPDGTEPDDPVFAAIRIQPRPGLVKKKPVSNEVFQVYKRQFDYDPIPLDARIEHVNSGSAFWRLERVSVTVPYSDERMIVNLFIPKNTTPPYQTVIYFPGSATLTQTTSEHLDEYFEFPTFLAFLVRSGRAVAFPTYRGTFEREHEPQHLGIFPGADTISFTNFAVELTQDFRRSVDYLESRDDIDPTRLSYYGMSWGGVLAGIIPAVEPRLSNMIVLAGGLIARARPEVDPVNYLPRIEIPALMMVGEFDSLIGYEIAAKPMFDMLGTPDADKRILVYKTDHIPPKKEYIAEILAFLDERFGEPVRLESANGG